jgi:SEC-C motif
LIPQYESFLDATPEKGVIVVEYWWQPSNRLNMSSKRRDAGTPIGGKTSMVFFKRILASEKCWCGSGKNFAKCHRRADDWTYVTLDPDRRLNSPVVLLERSYPGINFAHARRQLAADRRLLWLDDGADRAEWALPAHPPIVNDIGQLVLGSIEITARGLRLETNSEIRLEHLDGAVRQLLGANLGTGETRRAEPQKIFTFPTSGGKKGV